MLQIAERGGRDAGRGTRTPLPAPTPEIAFAWPLVVFAGDEACYVADTVNHRILKVKLDYGAAEKAEIQLR